MKLNVSGKHLEMTDALYEHVSRRAEKFKRFWNRVTFVDVVMEKRGAHTYFFEYVVHADGHRPFVSHEKHDDLYAAIDLAAAKVERQLRSYHGKLVRHG